MPELIKTCIADKYQRQGQCREQVVAAEDVAHPPPSLDPQRQHDANIGQQDKIYTCGEVERHAVADDSCSLAHADGLCLPLVKHETSFGNNENHHRDDVGGQQIR